MTLLQILIDLATIEAAKKEDLQPIIYERIKAIRLSLGDNGRPKLITNAASLTSQVRRLAEEHLANWMPEEEIEK